MSNSLFPEQFGRSSKPVQTLLEQVRVGGNLETGDLIQIINHFRPTYRRQKVCPQQLPKGTQKFVGRQAEIGQIDTAFQQGRGVVISTIAGMGGIGKTELGIQYALAYRERYKGGILWLNAASGDLATQIVGFVDTYILEMPEEIRGVAQPEFQLRYCLQYWNGRGRVLLILDDVGMESAFREVVELLPPDFRVLVTTRIMGLDAGFFELPLEILPLDAALQLLRGLLGAGRVDGQLVEAEALCEAVGRLPLALELMGRYLVGRRLMLLAELGEKLMLEGEVLARDGKQVMTATRGVLAAFEVSWQGLSAAGQQVGMVLGLFGSDGFGWDLVARIGVQVGLGDERVLEARDELYQGHWMQVARIGLFRLHPLIEQFLERKMAEAGQQQEMRQGFVDVLLAIAQDVPSQPTLAEVAELGHTLPHLKTVAKNFCTMLSGEDLIWPSLAVARFYEGQGLYGLAEPWYKQSVEITQSALGEEHSSYAASLHNLAVLYRDQGRCEEAEPLHRKALEIKRSALGEDHLSYATSLHNLAQLYETQGLYGKAEPLYLKALEIIRSALGEDHPSYAISMHSVAALYKSQGRYGKAEPLYLKALEIKRSALGEEHASYAATLNNLAGLYSNSFKPWKWFKAVQLGLQGLRIELRTLGWRHPTIRISIYNVFVMLLIPAALTGVLTQGLLISLKIHSILPLLQSVMAVLLIILINRSGIEDRLWAKGKHKLSKYKSRKSPKTPPKRQI